MAERLSATSKVPRDPLTCYCHCLATATAARHYGYTAYDGYATYYGCTHYGYAHYG